LLVFSLLALLAAVVEPSERTLFAACAVAAVMLALGFHISGIATQDEKSWGITLGIVLTSLVLAAQLGSYFVDEISPPDSDFVVISVLVDAAVVGLSIVLLIVLAKSYKSIRYYQRRRDGDAPVRGFSPMMKD
jgi:hypothetical protein